MKLLPYLVWPLLGLVSGCASNGQDDQRLAELELQITQLNAEVQQMKHSIALWQQVAPQVNELLAIEQDLDLLSTQLQLALNPQRTKSEVMVAQESKSPGIVEQRLTAPTPLVEVPEVSVPEQAPVKEAFAEKRPTVAGKKKAEFAVQLASTRKQSQLKTVHQRLVKDYPPLRQHPVNVEQVEVRGQRYFRLKLGAFENKAQGQALCAELRPFHPQCLLSHYTDNPTTL
ncbi:SPOR domain-containing protein [Pseudoalteromonas rubra]|uniref:SPOR domain-containing protein n=1 Tax=Pseudoalteromonas rubra TaxID=43658 RepID=UPI002DBEBE4B|nr:SPOR domain-containing protein [Pseudoalteromonas rubra]MEC4091129.1 SPOR domain-containing protein [Pseudoalteromonas rubra]